MHPTVKSSMSNVSNFFYITLRCASTAGNLYMRCLQELARSIKLTYLDTVSSMGRPNPLLTTSKGGPERHPHPPCTG